MKSRLSAIIVLVMLVSVMSQVTRAKPSATSAVSPVAQKLGIAHGAYIRPTVNYGTEIGQFNSLVQKKLAIDMFFIDWSYGEAIGKPFDPFLLNQIQNQLPASDRPVIMLTWMPQNGRVSLGCDADYSGAVPLSDIVAGRCDDYIRGFAQELKKRPERFILRFAHEMNVSSSVWWPGHFGQDASAYVAMWRHVHDVVASQQVGNVEWLWGPAYSSFPGDAWNNTHNYYPGDAYVDWIGPDGYNWFVSFSPPLPWWSFTTLYDAALTDFACTYAKPQLIHEVGSIDDGSGANSKAAWISDAYQQLPTYPFVRGVIWFNDYAFGNSAQADFRVTTSTGLSGAVNPLPAGSGAWTNAYRTALAASVYSNVLPSLAASTPPAAYCGDGEAVFSVQPSIVLVTPGLGSVHTLTGLLYPDAVTPSLILPPAFTGSVAPGTLPAPWGRATINLQTSSSTPLGTHTVTVQVGSVNLPIQVRVLASVHRVYLPLALK